MTGQISTALVGAFNFDSNGMTMWNPAFTFQYTIVAAAIAADRQLNLPLITATDTLAVLGLAQTFTAAQTVQANLISRLVRPETSLTYDLGSNGFKYNYAYLGLGMQINVNQYAFQIANNTGSGMYFNNVAGSKGFELHISTTVIARFWAATDQGAVFIIPATADPPNATPQGNFYIFDNGAGDSWFRLSTNSIFADVEQRETITVTPGATVTLTHHEATNVYSKWTAGENETVNASGTQRAGQRMDLLILNDGTAPRTITFGTGFKPSATIVGTNNKLATICFTSDGTNWWETSRTLLL